MGIIAASAIVSRLIMSDHVIGLTMVVFGASMPERFVNIVANANGYAIRDQSKKVEPVMPVDRFCPFVCFRRPC